MLHRVIGVGVRWYQCVCYTHGEWRERFLLWHSASHSINILSCLWPQCIFPSSRGENVSSRGGSRGVSCHSLAWWYCVDCGQSVFKWGVCVGPMRFLEKQKLKYKNNICLKMKWNKILFCNKILKYLFVLELLWFIGICCCTYFYYWLGCLFVCCLEEFQSVAAILDCDIFLGSPWSWLGFVLSWDLVVCLGFSEMGVLSHDLPSLLWLVCLRTFGWCQQYLFRYCLSLVKSASICEHMSKHGHSLWDFSINSGADKGCGFQLVQCMLRVGQSSLSQIWFLLKCN